MSFQIKKCNWIWICVFIIIFLIPAAADACPYCAGQDNKISDILLPIAVLLGAPFAVVGVFIAVVIKNNKSEKENN